MKNKSAKSLYMNVWQKILSSLEDKVDPQNFDTWLKPTRLSQVKESVAFVDVPNEIFKEWILENVMDEINRSVVETGAPIARFEFMVHPITAGMDLGSKATRMARFPQQAALDFDSIDHQLNPKYTFDTFVVGSSNQFAHAAARAVAESPSKAYNPLFIYGGVGLGKTHLMHAIGHMIKRHNSKSRLTYASTEKFTNDVISSLRYDKMVSFREKYRNVDALLIDDVQFIAGKERTQEEFFHLFNALYDNQKQLVISSDCPPKDIPTIEERLKSRFEWGLIADIQPPDLETKIAILQKKAESEKVKIPDNVAMFIASKIKSNIRELEGSLIRLVAYCQLKDLEINVEVAQQVLRSILDSQEKRITIEMIQKAVSEQFSLKVSDLKAKNNSKSISYPRQIAMYLAKQLTTASLPEIGREFNGKHHTTVLHSIHKIEELRKSDKDLNRLINKVTGSFQ
ncbi:MAG: chromosomal replication initiator protein DnaA [Terriglobia bacterium]